MNKFVTVLLNGGLGNQLYQYAFGRSLSIKHNCKLNLDISIFDTFHNTFKNSYRLNDFNISNDVNISKNFSSFQLLKLRILTKLKRKNTINLKFSKLIFDQKYNKIFFDFDFKEQRTNMINISEINSIYYGYWQTIEYFDHIKHLLINEFSPKENLKDKINKLSTDIIKTNSIALHIRGGDMQDTQSTYTYVENQYYENAIKFFQKKYGKVTLNVMTDDINLAKKQISEINKNNSLEVFFFNELNLNDLEEFYLFKLHKNFIVSRSTFSWWSSYLCEDQNKLITLPNEWYRNEKTSNGRIAKNMIIL